MKNTEPRVGLEPTTCALRRRPSKSAKTTITRQNQRKAKDGLSAMSAQKAPNNVVGGTKAVHGGPRSRCPRERSAKASPCERLGCPHLTAVRSRACGCCLVQLGEWEPGRFSMLRKYADDAKLWAEYEAALLKLNAIPRRGPTPKRLPYDPNR